MNITSRRLTLGTKPEVDFVGKGTPRVVLNVAENHNVNTGTKDDPVWETKSTSWYRLAAFGETAKQLIADKLKEGDSIELTDGKHSIDKKKVGNENKYYHNYVIFGYKKLSRSKD